jgi:hypothetical protein
MYVREIERSKIEYMCARYRCVCLCVRECVCCGCVCVCAYEQLRTLGFSSERIIQKGYYSSERISLCRYRIQGSIAASMHASVYVCRGGKGKIKKRMRTAKILLILTLRCNLWINCGVDIQVLGNLLHNSPTFRMSKFSQRSG